jgi:muramoyltetrapeptide carboxypeptidase
VGCSDATALLHLWAQMGAVAVHGPNVWELAEADPAVVHAALAALAGEGQLGWPVEHLCGPTGDVEGVLCGGNLTTLLMALTAGHVRLPDHGIVVLEDSFETLYSVDRMLCALRDSGALSQAEALVLGRFDFVAPTSGQPSLDLHEVATELFAGRLPVYTGAPVGHQSDSCPFIIGAPATISGGWCEYLRS